MKFKIDPQILENYPIRGIGIIIAKNINNHNNDYKIIENLREQESEIRNNFNPQLLEEQPDLIKWRNIFKQFGANPEKHFSSIESLLKRILGGQSIPDINPLVNLYNTISIKHIIPCGGEDLDQLCGDLELSIATGKEIFSAIGQTKIKHPSPNEIIYKDTISVTSRKWNWRECDRTKFTVDSKNIVLIFEIIDSISINKANTILQETSSLIQNNLGGDIETKILDKNNLEYDFKITGKDITECQKKYSQKSKKQNLHKFIYLENSLESKIQKNITEIVSNSFSINNPAIEILYPDTSDHGDFACNISLQLSKQLKKNPREIGEIIKNKLNLAPEIKRIEIAGPGFLNFFIDNQYLKEFFLSQQSFDLNLNYGNNKPIAIEYSQPNIAKPLGAHHLITTILGQTLCNLYSFLQFDVKSVNHIGDWGTQFGKLIYAYQTWGNKEEIEKNPIPELLKLYIKFHNEAEKNEDIEDFGRAEFLKLEQGDQQNRKLWQWICDISLQEIEKIYKKLDGINFKYTIGESFYEKKMEPILKLGETKGFFKKGEKGALMYFFEDNNIPPLMLKRSDGATLYATRDLAQIQYRSQTWNILRNIMVVDVAQELHFKQVFTIAKKLELNKTSNGLITDLIHIKFGRMQFRDKKMSTRKGNIILAEDVISEAITRAKILINSKESQLNESEKNNLAKDMAIGAIKYNILSQNRISNIIFDWDKMLSFDGNSAPYLQYTYARSNSILKKAKEQNYDFNTTISPEIKLTNKERELLILIQRFPQIILRASEEYYPHYMCNHLYELAQKFNSFYNSESVLKATNNNDKIKRLQLVLICNKIIQKVLNILGIQAPEKM